MDEDYDGQLAGTIYRALCAVGARGYLLTAFFKDVLTQHFAGAATNVEEQLLRRLIWADAENSPIVIEDKSLWKPEAASKRPAILISRNDVSNVQQGTFEGLIGVDTQGHENFGDVEVGSHSILCLHPGEMGVELLGQEVKNVLKKYGPAFRRQLGLLYYKFEGTGKISRVKEHRDTFVVPLTVSWAWHDTWRLYQESPWLQRVLFRASPE